jgi:mono/diheme cytochrome c family protein
MRIRFALLSAAVLAGGSTVGAEGLITNGSVRSITLPPSQVELKPGTGMETTRGYCSVCHSLDYITTQPKFPLAKWQAAVTKMIKVYGAPITESNAKVIVEYITTAYGKNTGVAQ